MLSFLLLFAVVALLYFLVLKSTRYWAKKNVKTDKVVPIFGDSFGTTFGKESYPEKTLRLYKKAKGDRYIGSYNFQTPVLVLTCPDLVKQLCVKDFDHFLDQMNDFGEDDLWTRSLLGLSGEPWKIMRSTLSPSFTSSKMRAMFCLICQNADSFVKYFIKPNKQVLEVEFRDAFTRFTNDVVASTAFGIEIDSLENKNNEFYMMGKSVTDFSSISKKLAFCVIDISPKLADLLNISFFGRTEKDFFINIIKDAIKIREENNIKRPDMLGLLIESRKVKEKEVRCNETTEENFAAVKEHIQGNAKSKYLDDMEIAAQMFLFFFAGFDTVSTGLCFTAYELAINPDVQKRLIEEIDENRPKEWPPTYDTIMNMTYLDMVVTEGLRMWPPGIETHRIVTKPYTIKPELPHETPVHLGTGVHITIPIYGFHLDPKYFPDPKKFNPERFSPENRKTINPYTYLPFGVGPRNCIASRFALMEIKAVLFYLLSHFELVPIENTNIPLKLNKALFSLDSVNGFPLGLKKR